MAESCGGVQRRSKRRTTSHARSLPILLLDALWLPLSTHKRRRKDRNGVHDALLQALMDGVGSTHDKLMGLEAIDSKSGLF